MSLDIRRDTRRDKLNLTNKKEDLANEVNNLERDIDQAARAMGQEQGRAGDQMREAANSLRRNRVSDRIRATKDLVQRNYMEAARAGEREIQKNLEEVTAQLQDAEKNAKQRGAGGDETEENLDKTRQLANNIENLQQRSGASP